MDADDPEELAMLRAEREAFESRAAVIDARALPPLEGVLARMPEHQVARAVPTIASRPARKMPIAWIVAAAAAIPLAAGVLIGLGTHREPAPPITAVAADSTPPVAATKKAHHRNASFACEPDATDDEEPSCGSCSGEDDDAGE